MSMNEIVSFSASAPVLPLMPNIAASHLVRRHTALAECGRRLPCKPLKHSCEVGIIIKPAKKRHLGNRQVRIFQILHRKCNPSGCDVLQNRTAHFFLNRRMMYCGFKCILSASSGMGKFSVSRSESTCSSWRIYGLDTLSVFAGSRLSLGCSADPAGLSLRRWMRSTTFSAPLAAAYS